MTGIQFACVLRLQMSLWMSAEASVVQRRSLSLLVNGPGLVIGTETNVDDLPDEFLDNYFG